MLALTHSISLSHYLLANFIVLSTYSLTADTNISSKFHSLFSARHVETDYPENATKINAENLKKHENN